MNPVLLPLPLEERNDEPSLPLGEGGGDGKRRTGLPIVLDTNIILDTFVFNDPAAEPVRQGLTDKALEWLATQPMRDELERVLGYPKIVRKLKFYNLGAQEVLAKFDQNNRIVDVAPKASVTCSDADDQKFIDLAVQYRALLLSKDKAVISMKKRLIAQGIRAQTAM